VKSTVEPLSPTRVRLTVEVPFEELKPNLDEAYRSIAKQISIPGFRKGKVPAAIIDQRVGRPAVVAQAVNDAIPQLYVSALQENKVQPLSQPEVDVPGDIVDGEDLTFTAELDVVPEITLPDYSGFEVTVDNADVTDEDVEQELQTLRERFGSLETVERPAEDGDYLTIDLSASKDGEPIEDAKSSGVSYKVGSGSMLEGLDDAVRGKSAGEEATFVGQLASGEYAGQDVDITVTVQAVKEQKLPELDDDFAQLASEFDTLDELTADLREKSERRERVTQAGAARDAVLKKLIEATEAPVPDRLVDEQVQARRESIRQQLAQFGMTEEQYLSSEGQTDEGLTNELRENAIEQMKTGFILDAIAEKEEFPISEDEFTQHLLLRAQQSRVDPNEFIQHAVQHGHLQEYMGELRRNKALGLVVESATITDEAGRPVDLKRLRPDGTYAEDDDAPEAAETAEASAEDKSDD
jgi:trigger factor